MTTLRGKVQKVQLFSLDKVSQAILRFSVKTNEAEILSIA